MTKLFNSPIDINMTSRDPILKEVDIDESKHLLDKKINEDTDLQHAERVVVCSSKLLLGWLVCFIFMVAYQAALFTFGQYVYIRLQKESFPNFTTETTKSKCDTNTSSPEYETQVYVQEQAAKWGIYFYMAGGLTSIIANFVLGSYTDRFGRKFLFIFPCLGSLFRTVLATILMKFDMPLYYFLIGLIIEGCTGQVFAMFQVASIYASDITVPGKQRSFAIVVMGLAFGIGTAFPAVVTGYILTVTQSFLIPMYIACVLLFVALLLMFMLPETYQKEDRNKRQYATFYDNLKDAVNLYVSKTNSGRRWMYIILFAVFVLTSYDIFGRAAVEALYLLNTPFCFGPDKIGIFNSLKAGIQQVIGIILVAILLMFTSDEVIALIGCISYGASFVLEALATSEIMLFIVTVVGCCGLLTAPMVRSIMSQMTSPQKQGAMFASLSVGETTINLISAISSNTIYLSTVSIYRGFIFFVYAGLNGICILLMVIFMIGSRRSKKKYIEIE